jgi:hypothetical protein
VGVGLNASVGLVAVVARRRFAAQQKGQKAQWEVEADADGEDLVVWVGDELAVGVDEPGALALEVGVLLAVCVGVWDGLGEAEVAVALAVGEVLRPLAPVVGASDMDTT